MTGQNIGLTVYEEKYDPKNLKTLKQIGWSNRKTKR